MKQLITNGRIKIWEKGLFRVPKVRRTNSIMCSGSKCPLRLAEGDRRYVAIFDKQERES